MLQDFCVRYVCTLEYVLRTRSRAGYPQRLPSRDQVPITVTDQSGPLTRERIDLQIGFWTELHMNIRLCISCLYPFLRISISWTMAMDRTILCT